MKCYIIFESYVTFLYKYDENPIMGFKYNAMQCDFEQFDTIEQAADWMFTPFESWGYALKFSDEV